MSDAEDIAADLNHFSPPGSGRTEVVLGSTLVYKAEPSQTGGRLLCVEITVPPGQGVPPHRHRDEDEAFYVLEGEVIIEGDGCGATGQRIAAGGFFHGPRGRVHGFRCEGADPAKLLVFVTPGASIGTMFSALAALPRSEPAAVARVCEQHGIVFVDA